MDELPRVSPIGQDHHQQHIQPSSAPRPQVAKLQEEVGDLEEHFQSLKDIGNAHWSPGRYIHDG